MSFSNKYYPESEFGGFSDIDGTVRFYSRVNSLIKKEFTVLDVGCGRGEYQDDACVYRRNLRILKGKCKRVIGVDVDVASTDNPFIDEFFLIEGYQWTSIADNSIDLIICDYVLEHIESPDKLFLEFRRVLKVGGFICARTPNLFSYFGVAANFIPNRFHTKIVQSLQDARKPEDVFPKFYNCNSLFRMRRLLKSFGFAGVAYGYEDEPAYFSFSSIAFGIAKVVHQLTPSYFKTQLYLFARKEGDQGS